jgi:nucleoside-diphosphate-sugar epimerase
MDGNIASDCARHTGLAEQRLLITGASGFIGLHLCHALLRIGCEVHALCRSEPKIRHSKLLWDKVDLTDTQATRVALSKISPDIVWHLCSYAQGERELALVLPTFRGEVETAVNTLASLTESGCQRLIMAGSRRGSCVSLLGSENRKQDLCEDVS